MGVQKRTVTIQLRTAPRIMQMMQRRTQILACRLRREQGDSRAQTVIFSIQGRHIALAICP